MLPFTLDELDAEIAAGNVTSRPHPFLPYNIFNYTAQVQYARNWNNVTKNCRGLILDHDFNVVARPFEKFFNYTEIVPDPIIFGKRCWASDKMDGSLGIIYPNQDGTYSVATRGSFTSDQALWATRWLTDNMPEYSQPRGMTTLVEIIYRDNRIVLDYGEFEGLVLLAAVDNYCGADLPHWDIDWWDGEKAEIFRELEDADSAYHRTNEHDFNSKEGMVLTWYKYDAPSFRLKVKNSEYVRLHGVIHNFSAKKVWQSLSEGRDFMKTLDDVPDEFYELVRNIKSDLEAKFREIERSAKLEYETIEHLSGNRKRFAAEAKFKNHSKIMFNMLDGKDYSPLIWKMITPKEEVV